MGTGAAESVVPKLFAGFSCAGRTTVTPIVTATASGSSHGKRKGRSGRGRVEMKFGEPCGTPQRPRDVDVPEAPTLAERETTMGCSVMFNSKSNSRTCLFGYPEAGGCVGVFAGGMFAYQRMS